MNELNPKYDSRKSFYGKARVKISGNEVKLYSYSSHVASIIDGKPVVFDTYSATTLRHIKEFLLQHNFPADNKKMIEQVYVQKEI